MCCRSAIQRKTGSFITPGEAIVSRELYVSTHSTSVDILAKVGPHTEDHIRVSHPIKVLNLFEEPLSCISVDLVRRIPKRANSHKRDDIYDGSFAPTLRMIRVICTVAR